MRCTIQTGLPRHSARIIIPGSTLEMSTSTGAPAARARALGSMLAKNGTAVATVGTPPPHAASGQQESTLSSIDLDSAMQRILEVAKQKNALF